MHNYLVRNQYNSSEIFRGTEQKKLPGNLSDGRLISISYFPGYIFLSIHLVRKF